MAITAHGKIQGKTIELESDLGIPDGADVEVTVVISQPRPPIGKRGPQFGNCRGMLTIVEEDDEHLKDFQDYMP